MAAGPAAVPAAVLAAGLVAGLVAVGLAEVQEVVQAPVADRTAEAQRHWRVARS